MSAAYEPSAWHDFFVAYATATAALLGLFFLGMSVRLRDVEAHSALRRIVAAATSGMVVVLAWSFIALAPGLGRVLLGAVVLTGAIVIVGINMWTVLRTREARRAGKIPVSRQLIAVSAFLDILLATYGGISLIVGWGGGMYIVMVSLVLVLVLWSFNAWAVMLAPHMFERDGGSKESKPAHKQDATPGTK